MNSRERVHAALRKKPVDRLPIFMWFHPETAARLGDLLEIPPQHVADAMGNDVHQTWVSNNYAMEGIVHEKDGDRHCDDWGIVWERQLGFNQIAGFPLAGAVPTRVLEYVFPYHAAEQFFAPMRALAAQSQGFFLGCDVSPCIYEMYWRLRGMEGALLDMVESPALAAEMFRRCADFALFLAGKAMDEFPLDWLWTGDDVASQAGMLFSPRLWRALVRPELARLFAAGKQRGLWVAYHCCGALRPIVPDLVEMGLDVLNPVQSNCPGMDPLELKREFGASLAFMGGVDTQDLLPYGTPLQVERAITDLIEGMTADGGGYILAASHTIPPETPDENIFAMYAAAGVSREEIFDRAAAIRKGSI
jgi:uroporphyrinogen decarboxylase